jgi:zinc transporter ZupT
MNLLNITLLVGAALVGGLTGIYLHGRITKDVKVVLAFSGAYLFALAILHLMPEIYHSLSEKAGLYILLGFLLQIGLEYFSKGIEHGHLHHSDQVSGVFPLGIYISLFLHSFIEGLPLAGDAMEAMHLHGHEGHSHNHSHNDALLIGIAIHKIPEALALTALLFSHYKKLSKTLGMLLLYAIATPLGMWAGIYFMQGAGEDAAELYAILLSIAVGIFLHVSTTIIFEAEEHHKFNIKKSIAILLGLALVWISTAL